MLDDGTVSKFILNVSLLSDYSCWIINELLFLIVVYLIYSKIGELSSRILLVSGISEIL